MKNRGLIIIWLSIILTIILWFLSKQDLNEISDYPILSINQLSALIASILFSWSMILSTRLNIIENLFNGIDKVYKTHKKVSQWGFILIIIHPLALGLNNTDKILKYFLPFHKDFSVNFGVYAFWIIIYLIVITLVLKEINLKYNIWKISHKFINLGMIFVLIHTLFVKSDTSIYFPLGLWINTFIILSVLSGLYKLLFYNYFAPHYTYIIKSISKLGSDMYDIKLIPENKMIKYTPGQFAYVSFKSKSVNSESHPFCIASYPNSSEIRFVIKELGDFTKTLNKLKEGEKAIIYGPHGKISERYYKKPQEDAVFIGGGIGIAPFLAMFRSETKESNRKIFLYYCTKYQKEAVFDEELFKISDSNNKLYYYNQCSREGDGHIQVKNILKPISNINNTSFYLCSTSKMMNEIEKELIKAGIEKNRIIKEDFEMF